MLWLHQLFIAGYGFQHCCAQRLCLRHVNSLLNGAFQIRTPIGDSIMVAWDLPLLLSSCQWWKLMLSAVWQPISGFFLVMCTSLPVCSPHHIYTVVHTTCLWNVSFIFVSVTWYVSGFGTAPTCFFGITWIWISAFRSVVWKTGCFPLLCWFLLHILSKHISYVYHKLPWAVDVFSSLWWFEALDT